MSPPAGHLLVVPEMQGIMDFFRCGANIFVQFHLIFSYENKKNYYYCCSCILGMNGKSPRNAPFEGSATIA